MGAMAATAIANASSTPERTTEQTYMGGFSAPKLNHIKTAFIGCGARSKVHISQLATLKGVEVVGVCDLFEDLVEEAKKRVQQAGGPSRHKGIKGYFGDEHNYKKMLVETNPDLVYVLTPWECHARMAIDTMKAGAHVCVEVPLTLSLEESWQVVDTAELTQKHCMMLENVNYGRDELLFLNMCRQGIFGDLLHGEAAYIHDLRKQMHHVTKGRGTGSWRTFHWAQRNGNLYPTHGLGPVAQYMNLSRTEDNFRHLTSFSSPSLNRRLYAKKHLSDDHKLNHIEFKSGDLNTSIIKTMLGRTILVQWDVSSPRPYTRHNLIQGTKGTAAGFPTRVALDYAKNEGLDQIVFNAFAGIDKHGKPMPQTDYHKWSTREKLQALYESYEHPLYKRLKPIAKKLGGHGGMDAMMNYRVVECLHKGEALDQNVYEGALWSAVAPLSEKSVEQDSVPQDFPDFTRGGWKTTTPLNIIQ